MVKDRLCVSLIFHDAHLSGQLLTAEPFLVSDALEIYVLLLRALKKMAREVC